MKLVRWFRGYLTVIIKGYSPERFINLCCNHGILVWNIQKVENGFEFNIMVKGYKNIRQIARKTKTIPYIKKRYGFPFVVQHYKKRKGFLVGFVLAVVLVYMMSLYIWDIEVSGQYTHTEEAIVKYLNSIDVYAGVKKNKLSCQEIEDNIRKQYKDIGWVSAEIRGTRLLIKLTETNMPKPYVAQEVPCHIVAQKDGIVVSMITRAGTPKVSVGDVVKKGDILVSGTIDLKGDDQEIIRQDPIPADADIYIKSFYQYEQTFPLTYIDKVYTENRTQYYSLTLFGRELYLLNPLKNYDKYEKSDCFTMVNQLKLNHNFYLPVLWKRTQHFEFEEIEKTYTEEEALQKAQAELELYMSRLKKSDVKILDNQVQFQMEEDNYVAKGKLIVEERVTGIRKIKEGELIQEAPPTEEPKENIE